jgi:GT2 family glycosyltransferase
MNNKVYIVLLSYNGSLDTIECLESLLKLNYENYQIIVVDNSETLEPFESLIQWALGNLKVTETVFQNLVFPLEKKPIDFLKMEEDNFLTNKIIEKIVFVKANGNNGYAAGNNLALKYILKFGETDSFIWILNNDTIVDKEGLTAQASYLSKPENSTIGILGSKLVYYYKPMVIQAVGGKFNKTFYISTHVGEGQSIFKLKNQFQDIDYVNGASMFLKLAFLKKIGLLCEDFFLYYEELDWAYKSNSAGWKLDWCSDSIVYHKEGSSIGSSYDSKKKTFFSEVNLFTSRKIFVKKHFKLNFRFYFSSVLLILNRIRKGKFKLGFELLKITFDR